MDWTESRRLYKVTSSKGIQGQGKHMMKLGVHYINMTVYA